MKKTFIFLLTTILFLTFTSCQSERSSTSSNESTAIQETETETTLAPNRVLSDTYAQAIENETFYLEGSKVYTLFLDDILTFDNPKVGYNNGNYIYSSQSGGSTQTSLIINGVGYSSDNFGNLVEKPEGSFSTWSYESISFSDSGTAPFEGFESIDSTPYEYYAYGALFTANNVGVDPFSKNIKIIFYFKDNSLYAIKDGSSLKLINFFTYENLDQYVKFPG